MRLLLPAIFVALMPATLAAQSVQIRAALQDGRVQDLSAGSTVELAAKAVQQEARAQLHLTNSGIKNITVERIQLAGSSDFYILTSSTGSTELKPSESMKVDVRYIATTSARAQGQIAFTVREAETPAISVHVNLAGTAPEFSVQYALQTDNNARPVSPGGKIVFPTTLVEVASAAYIFVINQGSGNGTLDGVSLTGDSFELRDLSLLPVVVEPGKNVRWTVRGTPRQTGVAQGTLGVSTSVGEMRFQLEASARLSNFVFQVIDKGREETITPGGTIQFAETPNGGRSTLVLRVRNEQNASISISDLSTAAPFTITGSPVLPKTLTLGETFDIQLEFAPTQARAFIGRLRLGTDQFTLSGTGMGSALIYSYSNSTETTNVDPNGSITFRPAQIGKQSSVTMTVRNDGTSPVTLDTVVLADSRGRFSLSEVPSLPSAIAPGSEASFKVTFLPQAEGAIGASLVINAATFTLRGTGLPAPALPAVSITTSTATPDLLQQVPVGIVLSEPYDLELTGTLNIASEAMGIGLDPSVQFSTGGRAVTFRIAAGSRKAVFPNGLETVRIQTGSVAGTIVLSSTIATAMKADLTPAEPPSLRLTMSRSLPRLISGAVEVAPDNNSFTIRVAGIAPGRSLTKMKCQLVSTGRIKLSSEKLEFDLSLLSWSWFRSSQSTDFGGTFGISIPLRMNLSAIDPKSPLKVSDVIQAIAVTIEDELGASNEIRLTVE